MRRYTAFFVLALLACLWLPQAAVAEDVVGLWSTKENKSHVEIKACASDVEKLCGTIVWLKEPLNGDGEAKTDRNNPDETLRQRPIVGLPLLSGFVQGDDPTVWENGEIYNPEDGETYSSTMTLVTLELLEVRGYVGLPLFGKTQEWRRVK